MTRHHGVGQVPGVVEMNPTCFPELFEPSRDLRNLQKSKCLGVNIFRTIRTNPFDGFFMEYPRISMIPGVKPILLDLENPFLLSVSLEKLIFKGKNRKRQNEKNWEKKKNVLFFLFLHSSSRLLRRFLRFFRNENFEN